MQTAVKLYSLGYSDIVAQYEQISIDEMRHLSLL